MDGTPLQLALREMRTMFTSPQALGAIVAVALVLGVAGPFDTGTRLPLAQRLVYWLAVVVLTYGLGRATATLVYGLIAARITNRAIRVLIEGAICSIPSTLVVLAVNLVTFNGTTGIEPLWLWVNCLVISIAALFVIGMVAGPNAVRTPVAEPVSAGSAPAAGPAILERIPHPQRGRLLALSVKDHYVEVITEKGRSLVLIRLSDAIRETGAIRGLQIHRSHWIALDAVHRVTRRDGRTIVELTNGTPLPISRGYLPAAREAGLVV